MWENEKGLLSFLGYPVFIYLKKVKLGSSHSKITIYLYNSNCYHDEIFSRGIAKRNKRELRVSTYSTSFCWIKRNVKAAHTQCEYPYNLQWAAYPFASARRDWALPLSNLAASAFRSCVCLLFFPPLPLSFSFFSSTFFLFFYFFPIVFSLLDASVGTRCSGSAVAAATRFDEQLLHKEPRIWYSSMSQIAINVLIGGRYWSSPGFSMNCTAVAGGSTRDKAIRDPEPSTATYFEAVTLNGPFTLQLVQKSKHVPSLATYEYATGQFLQKTSRMYTCTVKYSTLNISTRIIFSLGIRER